jgi:peptide-methionine (S)-S-oxide reductase
MQIDDPRWRQAVAALDAGDVPALAAILAADPALVRDRLDAGDGYFARPYLLWFVAENPVRNGRLPSTIVEVTRAILAAAAREDVLGDQLAYALALVCSGRVVRECGVQAALIDVLVDAGADPAAALPVALPHGERAAAEHLLARGAPITLIAAASLGRLDDLARLGPPASSAERQAALMCAAVNGQPAALRALIALGVDVDAYGAAGFHPHATALHQAVAADCRAAVEVLAEAGADLTLRDRAFGGTPLGWAEHEGRAELAAYLRARMPA